jgi:hypothetical protein
MSPLDWVALAAVVTALAAGGRWSLTRVDAIGRHQRFPWVAIGLLVALAIGLAVPGFQRRGEEAELSAVASQLAGRPVTVHCQTMGQAFVDAGSELGWVPWRADGTPEAWTLIKRDQCRALKAYLGSDKAAPTPDQVVAVHVLTHEAMHLAGHIDEAEAECAAVQRNAMTAHLLGASSAGAQRLAEQYWTTIYPRMDDGYRTPDCRADGPLDERLPAPPWDVAG